VPAKLPQPPASAEDFEAPTAKREIPAELRDEPGARPEAREVGQVTTKLRTVDMEELLTSERAKVDGAEPLSQEDRETLPAPLGAPPAPGTAAGES
jgi:hypothetical protein